MLTTEAFNALLKILEEPPAHVVFILATTELHKVPETIVSRCTVVAFQKANPEEIAQSLQNILTQEKISAEPEVIERIAAQADGSFRDAVKLLESVANGKKKVIAADLEGQVTISLTQQVEEFIQIVMSKDEKQVVQFFQLLRQRTNDQLAFHKAVLEYLHKDLVSNYTATATAKLPVKVSHFLLTQLSALPLVQHPIIPFLSVEPKALELIFKSKEQGNKSGNGSEPTDKKKASTPVNKTIPAPQKETQVYPADIPEMVNVLPIAEVAPESFSPSTATFSSSSDSSEIDGDLLIAKWEDFLQQMKSKNSSIAALLRSSKPVAGEKGKAKIEVYYQFHREQLQQPKFLKMMEECVHSLLGGKVLFEFTLAQQSQLGARESTLSGKVNEDDNLIKLAKEILV
jgi:DNA polymerase-3 subunit gamma/tau